MRASERSSREVVNGRADRFGRSTDGAGRADKFAYTTSRTDSSTEASVECERWWLLRTRSRHEKVVAAWLEGRGIQCFLPLVRVSRTRRRGRVRIDWPLFPGYLFLYGGARECRMVREANKVAGVLPVEDQALLTDELRQLQRVLTSGRTVELHGPRQRGKRLRIESGPLCGVEGIVPQQSSSLRMYVPVTVLKRTVSVSVDACALEAISPRGRAKGNALEPQT